MVNLRVKLHCPGLTRGIFHRRQSTRGLRHSPESGGKLPRFIAVGHPNGKTRRQIAEERGAAFQDFNLGVSVFAFWSGNYLAAELVGDEMQSVADSQNRNSER